MIKITNAKKMQEEIKAVKSELAGAKPVPYIVHESAMARHERVVKSLIIAIVIMCIAFAGYIGFDRWQDGQWEETETFTTQTNHQDGNAIITNGDVEIGKG